MSDTPKLPPTPSNLRKTMDLPPDSDCEDIEPTELPPLDFNSDRSLLGFSREHAPDMSGFTPAQLYDLNQQLFNDSLPQRPLMDALSPMSALRSEYENGSAIFLKQIDWLIANGYDSIRRTRGDGDCFYRSLGFAYVESLLRSTDREFSVAGSSSLLSSINETLHSAGIEKLVYEDFYEEFSFLIENIIKPNSQGMTLTVDRLLDAFQNPEVSNSAVIYLRFLTSAQIRLNRESYEGFLVHPDTRDIMDVDSYCANVVQAMGKEADNVEIEALSRALQLNIDVAYVNGVREDGMTDFIKFRYGSSEAPPLTLLYRPGHYDILVQKHGK